MREQTKILKYVSISDEEGLRSIGCPWKTTSLYTMRTHKTHPKLFTKIGRKVYLVVEELERMMKAGVGK